MRKVTISAGLIFWCTAAEAHAFGGSGFLHPLTGPDHLLAMVAVGAWSAQLGGKALWRVPLAFLVMMCLGGITGISQFPLSFVEYGIALSVVLMGLAIAINQRPSWLLAAIAVGLFGFCHGYAHGLEIPKQAHSGIFITGFLITTLGLHIVGAAGGLLLIEEKQGFKTLRFLGAATSLAGVVLFMHV
jgi:urease accessory protein